MLVPLEGKGWILKKLEQVLLWCLAFVSLKVLVKVLFLESLSFNDVKACFVIELEI